MIKRIELYVLTRTLISVLSALVIIASIIILIDVVELSRTLGSRAELSLFEMLGLTLMRTPLIIMQLLPFVFLFGVLSAFTGLNRRSELIAMRAAGVSAWRFILPAAAAALVIGVGVVTAANPLAVALNGRFETVQSQLLEGGEESKPQEVWLSQSEAREQILLHAADRNELGTRLFDVSVRFYVKDDNGGLVFVRRLDAERADLVRSAWRLSGVRLGVPGQRATFAPTASVPTTLDAKAVLERFANPRTVSFWDLPVRIEHAENAVLSPIRYQLRWHQLLASPLLYAAMSILGAGFSLRLLRLGGLAALAGAAVALGFVLFFANELLSAMASAELLPPYGAAWAPPLLAFLAGLTLLAFTEDA
jgi:lipopolysaccharide export system permease protein